MNFRTRVQKQNHPPRMHEPQNHELEWTQPSETQNGFTWILIPEFFSKNYLHFFRKRYI